MSQQPPTQPVRVRFDSFELDCGTGELYKDGQRLKLQDQPARLLTLLVTRAGKLVSRIEIQDALWEDGQFVEFEHAINVAVKKIREALKDDPLKPRLIETLPRKGYRFIASVEEVLQPAESRTIENTAVAQAPELSQNSPSSPSPTSPVFPPEIEAPPVRPKLAPPDEDTLVREFALAATPARILFLAVQAVYLTVYCLALTHMYAVSSILGEAGVGWLAVPLLIGAAGSIPVRLYLVFTVGLGHPAAGMKYRRMLPYLMPWDWLWAPSPFLASHAIGPELALVLSAVMVYPPISQLILMRSIDHSVSRL